MRRARFVSLLLLLIVGLTVLSPHFAWEVMATDAHHDAHSGTLVLTDSHGHEGEHPRLDHHDEHACSGHMFSHMPVQASAVQMPLLLQGRDGYSGSSEPGFASRDPETVERPPRTRLA